MKVPQYARYDYCNKKACEFLEEFNITTFPVDAISIIQNNKWGLIKYSTLMLKFKCDRETVINSLGSKDGYTQYDGFNYTIAYNDDDNLGSRTRFTLMHEIGHIYLNHLIDFESTRLYRGSLTKAENKVLENEANAFARNVLVPTSMLDHLVDKSINNISRHFGITPRAARTRLNFYSIDISANRKNNISTRLLHIFKNFYYKKTCTVCGYHIVSAHINYCPICGNKSLHWGDGDKMKYPIKIRLNSNSKALRCPICDSEDINDAGEYCPICGTMLVNRCTNYPDEYNEGCGALAAGNARYCISCGCETTFLRNSLLEPWDQVEASDIPFSFDDEDNKLPFN